MVYGCQRSRVRAYVERMLRDSVVVPGLYLSLLPRARWCESSGGPPRCPVADAVVIAQQPRRALCKPTNTSTNRHGSVNNRYGVHNSAYDQLYYTMM